MEGEGEGAPVGQHNREEGLQEQSWVGGGGALHIASLAHAEGLPAAERGGAGGSGAEERDRRCAVTRPPHSAERAYVRWTMLALALGAPAVAVRRPSVRVADAAVAAAEVHSTLWMALRAEMAPGRRRGATSVTESPGEEGGRLQGRTMDRRGGQVSGQPKSRRGWQQSRERGAQVGT